MHGIFMLILYFTFASMAHSAENNKDSLKIIAPSYSNFIGNKFSQIKEIDSMLSPGQFSTLYNNESYGVSIYGHRHILNKWHKARFKYVFFTKTIGYQGPSPIEEILDIVTIDMNNFSINASIWLDECTCKGQKDCQTIAIYYHDERMADKGIRVKPQKVWRPNISTGKLEELPPESVRCGSQAPEEEP